MKTAVRAMSKHNKGGVSKKQQKKRDQFESAFRTQLQLFNSYYVQYFGEERWVSLLEALQRPTQHVALLNRFTDPTFSRQLIGADTSSASASSPSESEAQIPLSVPFFSAYLQGVTVFQLNGPSVAIESEANRIDDGVDGNIPIPLPTTTADVVSPPAPGPQRKSISSQKQKKANSTQAASKLGHTVLPPGAKAWPSPGTATSLCPTTNLCCYYPLDAASLFPVEALQLQPNHHVLDLCAAPGGKALTILQKINLLGGHGKAGSLTCNDVSPDRRLRLKNVIRRYLPSAWTDTGRVDVIGYDATQRRFVDEIGENKFDRVLLDAPCSSERHLIQDFVNQYSTNNAAANAGLQQSSEFMQWAPGRAKSNAERQFSLLWNAVKVCRPGGLIVYSTCALSSVENDDVIAKLVRKLQGEVGSGGASNDPNKKYKKTKVRRIKVTRGRNGEAYRVIPVPIDPSKVPFGEATKFGWHMLPDHDRGAWGPIFMAVLRKEEYIPEGDDRSNSGSESEEEEEDDDDDDHDDDGHDDDDDDEVEGGSGIKKEGEETDESGDETESDAR